MSKILVFMLLILAGCQCNKPKRTPEEMRDYIEQLKQRSSTDSVQTVSVSVDTTQFVATFDAKFMKKNGNFYPKAVSFAFQPLSKGNIFTATGQDCALTYTIVGNPVITEHSATFTAYTDFDQWFAGEEIQRVPCVVYFKGSDIYQVTMGNRSFYAEVPPISKASPDNVYQVKKGDTPTSVARKFNVSVNCLSKTVNLQVGDKITIKCQ